MPCSVQRIPFLMGKYKNFNELKQHETEGIDYHIRMRNGTSGIAVIAPHGGGIEPGTVDIADSVAGDEHAFYCFEGIKKEGNADLHITSENFDEPNGVRIAEEADFVLAIHGCSGTERVIFVGGNDFELRKRLSETLVQAGFIAEDHPRPGLEGLKPTNICNLGRTGRGCQVEFSEGMRKKMFENQLFDAGGGKRKEFLDIVAALRKALDSYLPSNWEKNLEN
jgi:phage replication-related protein YjqB (UPF0714/DUF867 family)